MKNIMHIIFILVVSIQYGYSQKNIYVSETTGSDLVGTKGTDSNPFKTLKQAFAINNENGNTFLLKEGVYYNSIVMTNKSNITIKADTGENVIFKGTTAIPSTGWVGIGDNIYEKTLTYDIWQLFIDDKEQVMARWPNAQFSDETIYDHQNWAIGLNNSANVNGHMVVNTSNGYPNLGTSVGDFAKP